MGKILLCGVVAILLFQNLYCESYWTLKTGEKFWGNLVSQDINECVIKTKYGNLTFSLTDISEYCENSSLSNVGIEKDLSDKALQKSGDKSQQIASDILILTIKTIC